MQNEDAVEKREQKSGQMYTISLAPLQVMVLAMIIDIGLAYVYADYPSRNLVLGNNPLALSPFEAEARHIADLVAKLAHNVRSPGAFDA